MINASFMAPDVRIRRKLRQQSKQRVTSAMHRLVRAQSQSLFIRSILWIDVRLTVKQNAESDLRMKARRGLR